MKMLLSTHWVDRDTVMEIRNPQDNTIVDTVPKASHRDVEIALASAEAAKIVARKLPIHERIAILRKAADLVLERQQDFARTIATEGVKTIREARKEVTRCVETLRLSSEEARRLGGEVVPFDQQPGSESRIGYWVRDPIGMIVAITPFNDPLNLVAHKVGPAIAAGNVVILKPHKQTPLSALKLAQVFQEAGLPPGILQVLTGDGSEIGPVLVSDPRVRMVSFTGGLKTGETIARQAGLKKLAMELGSNCPTIVMDDANLDLALPSIVSGAFWAAGQNCLHVQRVLVQSRVYEDVKQQFIEQASGYRVGDKMNEDTDMGPLVDQANAIRVERVVNETIAARAELLTGGIRTGNFYRPTILEHVPVQTTLYQEEIYGPVTILEQFHSYEEAITQANNAKYGLQAAIFTRDVNTALHAVSDLHYSGVMINDSTDYRIDAMPFGGIKGSGLGREGVRFAAQEMTEIKLACIHLQTR